MGLTPPRIRLSRKDWFGDAVLTVFAGAVLLAAVFLPWANLDGDGVMDFGLTRDDGIRGVLETGWGLPALGLALAVLVMGAAMLVLGPGRVGVGLGVLTAAAGLAALLIARDATFAAYGFTTQAGLGVVVTMFAGVVLIPIGLSAAAVAAALLHFGRAAPTDPPVPESAPPS